MLMLRVRFYDPYWDLGDGEMKRSIDIWKEVCSTVNIKEMILLTMTYFGSWLFV